MSSTTGLSRLDVVAYQPGVCNIGPAEIARRRRSGHAGVVATVVLLAALIVLGAPHWARVLLILPAGVSASGYLQAALRFCAGFGSAGVFNFGPLGTTERVADPQARRLDGLKSVQIGLASLAIGLAVSLVAVFLPLG